MEGDGGRHPGLQAAGVAALVASIIWGGMVLATLPTTELVTPSIEERRQTRGPAPAPVPQIRADYPLAAGWPPGERIRGPDRLHTPLVLDVCYAWRTVPSGDDRIRATTRAGTLERDRELHTYPDAETARAAYVDLSESFRRCDGEDRTQMVALASHTGFQVLTYDDRVEVVTLVQRGRGLVVAVDSRPDGDLPEVEALAREQWAQLTAPLERLCEFTAEGCTRLHG